MKYRFKALLCVVSFIFILTACGKDPELTKFGNSVDAFCTRIAEIDEAINNINPNAEEAVDELLEQLDDLDVEFKNFAELDFPEEFDYLESIADEASDYMTTAVENYHKAYSNGSYNEYTAEYARENYSRAYKRIQIIVSFLHGETPDGVDLSDSDDE